MRGRIFSIAVAAAAVLVVVVVISAARVRTLRPIVYGSAAPAPIEVDAAAAAGRLAAAVRFRTVSTEDGGAGADAELQAFGDWMRQQYPTVFRAIPHEVIGGHSLLFRWEGSDTSRLPILLAAHLDVVPVEAGTESAWTHAPFSGDIADGFVWGRGSLDDKNSALGILEAAEALSVRGFKPRRTIYLAFGQDEEISGARGAASIAALLQQRGVRLDYVLDEGLAVLDGFIPGMSRPMALIGTAEKGYATFDLNAEGPGGHSSVPSRKNPLSLVSRAVAKVAARPMPMRLTAPVRGMLAGIAPFSTGALRVALANLWLTRPLVMSQLAAAPSTRAVLQTVVTPTVFSAGTKENVVPQRAHAVVNMRILPGDTVQSLQQWMVQTIDDPQVEVTLRPGAVDPAPVTDAAGSGFAEIARATLAVYPDVAVAPGMMIGLTDSRHYAPLTSQVFRFLPARLRPEDVDRIHGTNERIAIGNYAEIIRFYATLLAGS